MIKVAECVQGVKQGSIFGKWTVLGFPFSCGRRHPGIINWYVVAKCTCGLVKAVALRSLTYGDSTGCKGCGIRKHGASDTQLYTAFKGMFDRCYRSNSGAFKHYGGRGIGVAAEWHHNFDAFRKWSYENGYAEGQRLQIDRRDNDKDYGSDNCQWVTARANNNNRRSTNKIEAFGETKSIKEWWRDSRCVCSYNGLRARLTDNWDAETAITTQSSWSGYDHQLARQRDENRSVKEKAKRIEAKAEVDERNILPSNKRRGLIGK